MNEWLSCTHKYKECSISLRVKSNSLSFHRSFLHCTTTSLTRCDIVYQVRTVGLFSHHRQRWAMAREQERERKTISYIIIHIKKKGTKKFNVQCTHTSTYTSLMVSKEQNGHPFCKRIYSHISKRLCTDTVLFNRTLSNQHILE
jgi:hypothetical protein